MDRPLGSATTKRAQVRGILEQLIDAELNPGDAIPSERALVVRLGVSRVTVRQTNRTKAPTAPGRARMDAGAS